MRDQFFTQPICFCYVVSSEERKAGKLFFAIPKYIPSCSFTRGRSSKARPWPKSRNFANASSKALLCQYYKYVGYCVSSRQHFYFFMSFLFRIQQLKKLRRSFIHFFSFTKQEITNLDFRDCYFYYYYRIQFLGDLPKCKANTIVEANCQFSYQQYNLDPRIVNFDTKKRSLDNSRLAETRSNIIFRRAGSVFLCLFSCSGPEWRFCPFCCSGPAWRFCIS